MTDEKSKQTNIYELALKAYDRMMAWQEEHIEPLKYAPSGDYIRKEYKKYLAEQNIDKYGNPLPKGKNRLMNDNISNEPQP